MSEATRIGAVLAGYRVESLLGRGGMSVVYLAEHVSLGRKVALKVMASPLAHDPSFRERFMRESQRAAGLDHPNVIPIYDAGEVDGGDADGLLYIAMRYVDGPDLRSLLRREGRLGVGRTLYMLEQVASALDAAHDNDLIHRDVKPSNILIAEPSEHVYLTDFGVAKQTSAPDLTRTGIFVGTIEYAAPEQIEGLTLDRRTDVYALGCVLYECLAGRPPFERDAEVAVMHAHLTSPPPRLTEVAPRPAQGARQDRRARDGQVARRALRDRAGGGGRRPCGSATQSRPPRTPSPNDTRSPLRSISVDGSGEVDVARRRDASARARRRRRRRSNRRLQEPLGSPAASAPPPDPPTGRRAPSMPRWGLTAILVALAAIVSATAAYLVARDDGGSAAASTDRERHRRDGSRSARSRWPRSFPERSGRTARSRTRRRRAPPRAQCACSPRRSPARIRPTAGRSRSSRTRPRSRPAYDAARAAAPKIANGGRCDGTFWGGAGPWVHEGTPPKPGGQRFCYFDGDDAVIVWTHERLGQANHRDILAVAREGDTDHAALFGWWRFWHHRIGKVAS